MTSCSKQTNYVFFTYLDTDFANSLNCNLFDINGRVLDQAMWYQMNVGAPAWEGNHDLIISQYPCQKKRLFCMQSRAEPQPQQRHNVSLMQISSNRLLSKLKLNNLAVLGFAIRGPGNRG
jgi:negative regulator of sigma E activity